LLTGLLNNDSNDPSSLLTSSDESQLEIETATTTTMTKSSATITNTTDLVMQTVSTIKNKAKRGAQIISSNILINQHSSSNNKYKCQNSKDLNKQINNQNTPFCNNNNSHTINNNNTNNIINTTPNKFNASTLSMSSPSAAVLFTLNSNSFSIPNELHYPNTFSNSNSTSKLLASKIEYINGTAELQSIVNDDNQNHNINNYTKSEMSTDLSCIDDSVINAFINDFSYEIVHK
jgi:hypothetical protein